LAMEWRRRSALVLVFPAENGDSRLEPTGQLSYALWSERREPSCGDVAITATSEA
jgi:hypothetical protein